MSRRLVGLWCLAGLVTVSACDSSLAVQEASTLHFKAESPPGEEFPGLQLQVDGPARSHSFRASDFRVDTIMQNEHWRTPTVEVPSDGTATLTVRLEQGDLTARGEMSFDLSAHSAWTISLGYGASDWPPGFECGTCVRSDSVPVPVELMPPALRNHGYDVLWIVWLRQDTEFSEL